jgi:hypothetical protein
MRLDIRNVYSWLNITQYKMKEIMKCVMNWCLSKLGYVQSLKLEGLKTELECTQKQLSNTRVNHNAEISDFNAKIADMNKKLQAQECATEDVTKKLENAQRNLSTFDLCRTELLIPSMDAEEYEKAIKLIQRSATMCSNIFNCQLNNLYDQFARENFKSNSAWGFYWCIANACASAQNEIAQHTNEDGISREWVSRLDQNLINAAQNHGISGMHALEIKIFEKVVPSIKEHEVGADILLIIAGNLLPRGGYRAIWIQGKREANSPYTLNFLRTPNEDGRTQYEKLRVMEDRSQGSFAIYTQYSTLPFLISIQTADMPASEEIKGKADKHKIDLSVNGIRTQELLCDIATSTRYGEFDSATSFDSFISSITPAELPLKIIGLSADNDGHNMLLTLQQHFDKKRKLARNIGHDRSSDFGR